jgi:hypothetical protein
MAVNASYEKYDRYLNGVTPQFQIDERGIDENARTRALYEAILALSDIKNTKALLQAALMELPDADPIWQAWKSNQAPNVLEDVRGYVLLKCQEAISEPHWLEREKLLDYAIAQLPKDDPAFTL